MKNSKVLVIDDSPAIFKSVKTSLERYGFQILEHACNGEEGIKRYEKYKPDIVILDIAMPVMDGLETAQILLKKDPSAKLLFLSAMGDDELIEDAKNLGVRHFIQKPFSPKDLIDKIDKALSES